MNDRSTEQQARVEQGSVDQGAVDQRAVDQGSVEQGTVDQGSVERQPDVARQGQVMAGEEQAGFLPDDRMSALRERWTDVQAGFVDNPQSAVQQAHQLVADLVNELTETFTRERTSLEGQWKSGGTADTEALRVALQRYRSFFNRLLGS